MSNYNLDTAGQWSPKVDVLSGQTGTTFQNLMFPAPYATNEGSNTNRLYIAFTAGQSNAGPRKIYVLYTDDQGKTWVGKDGTGKPTLGPFSDMVSQSSYTGRPVLDVDMTSNATSKSTWITYLEIGPTVNPFAGIDNVFATYSTNGFTSGAWQRITGDGFVKTHPMSCGLGEDLYTVYSS